jgi:predicted amidohydrolase
MRDLAAGEDFRVFESKHGRFGFLICEDMWHIDGAYLYFLDGVDAILVPSASPGRGAREADDAGTAEAHELGSTRVWRTLQDAMALYFRTWIAYVGRVGWEDGIVFSGNSRVLGPDGSETCALRTLDRGRLDARLLSADLERTRTHTPLRRDERPWILARGLARRLGYRTSAPPPPPEEERESR